MILGDLAATRRNRQYYYENDVSVSSLSRGGTARLPMATVFHTAVKPSRTNVGIATVTGWKWLPPTPEVWRAFRQRQARRPVGYIAPCASSRLTGTGASSAGCAPWRARTCPRIQSGLDKRTSSSRGVMIWIPKGFPSAGKSPSRVTMIFARQQTTMRFALVELCALPTPAFLRNRPDGEPIHDSWVTPAGRSAGASVWLACVNSED